MDFTTDALILLGLLLLISTPGIVILFIYARGKRLDEVPACPRCRHCVREIPDSHCPECGHDLSTTGVITEPFLRPRRPLRLRALAICFVLSLCLAAMMIGRGASNLTTSLVGIQERLSGIKSMDVNLLPNANYSGPVRQITVAWPGWLDPAQIVETTNADPEWIHPGIFPTRLSLTTEDGGTHEILVTHSGDRIELNQASSSPMADEMGPLVSSGDSSSLQQQLESWMQEKQLAGNDGQSFINLSQHLVQNMLDADAAFRNGAAGTGLMLPSTSTPEFQHFQQQLRLVGLASGGNSGYARMNASPTLSFFILLTAFVLVWIPIAVIVLMEPQQKHSE